MEMVVGHQFPMLIVGDTGTGKTRSIKKLISLLLNKKNTDGKYGWESGEMVLSATSTP
jgi:Cdc6-like AAA superfamily ATPase